MHPPKYHAQLVGTSKVCEIVHFSCEQHRETAQHIAEEFGFELTPFDGGAKKSTYHQYPHEFRAYCRKERISIHKRNKAERRRPYAP